MIQLENYPDVSVVNQLQKELQREDPTKAMILKLVYEGLTIGQIANELELHRHTVKSSWRQIKNWLRRQPANSLVRASSYASGWMGPSQ